MKRIIYSLRFFHSKLSFQNQSNAFLNALDKKTIRAVEHSHYMLPGFSRPWQPFVCPGFAIGVFQVNTLLCVNFSKHLKAYQNCGRAPRRLTCIFRSNLFNTSTSTYDFFVVVCLFVQFKASGYEHAAWSWYKRSEEKNKLTRRKLWVGEHHDSSIE